MNSIEINPSNQSAMKPLIQDIQLNLIRNLLPSIPALSLMNDWRDIALTKLKAEIKLINSHEQSSHE